MLKKYSIEISIEIYIEFIQKLLFNVFNNTKNFEWKFL